MSLSLAAVVPHSPLLLPTIGQEHSANLAATIASYEKLNEILLAKKIDTILLVPSLGPLFPTAFNLNSAEEFDCGFEEFGDLGTHFSIPGDVLLAHDLQRALRSQFTLNLCTVNPLDYGLGVPLFFLRRHKPIPKIVPLYPSNDLALNFSFGQKLKRELELSPKKIALISACVLSQKLSRQSPAGYSPRAKNFDKKVIAYLDNKDKALLQISTDLKQEVKAEGLNALSLLLGAVSDYDSTGKVLSYEAPFGIGLLTYNFNLP